MDALVTVQCIGLDKLECTTSVVKWLPVATLSLIERSGLLICCLQQLVAFAPSSEHVIWQEIRKGSHRRQLEILSLSIWSLILRFLISATSTFRRNILLHYYAVFTCIVFDQCYQNGAHLEDVACCIFSSYSVLVNCKRQTLICTSQSVVSNPFLLDPEFLTLTAFE